VYLFLQLNLLKSRFFAVNKAFLIRCRNSCSEGDDDVGGISGAWRQDEDSTEDQNTEPQPSSTQVGHARNYLFESQIILCSVDACLDTLRGKRTRWTRKEHNSIK
jgi:hypothetical protein